MQINIKKINSVIELHAMMRIPDPSNPLVTIIDHAVPIDTTKIGNQKMIFNFFNITVKRSFKGKLRYGRNHYDFDNGTMSFISPNQVISIDNEEELNRDGWTLLFHPDLLSHHPLEKKIKNYGFFSYSVNEALHLSDEENLMIESIIQNIQKEIKSRLDSLSQDIILSNIELLLNYCNRFYNRQFITRKMATNDLLSDFETLLQKYFSDNISLRLPSVEKLASELNVSSSYLSDMLRNVTGQNTQQHIHEKLIERAKLYLATTNLTVSEIAYQLGFDYSQSFSKLFKNKTDLTPLQFRNSFN